MYRPPCLCGSPLKYVGIARQEELVFQCLKCKRYTYYGVKDLSPHPLEDLESETMYHCDECTDMQRIAYIPGTCPHVTDSDEVKTSRAVAWGKQFEADRLRLCTGSD